MKLEKSFCVLKYWVVGCCSCCCLWWHCCCNISCHCFLEIVSAANGGSDNVVNVTKHCSKNESWKRFCVLKYWVVGCFYICCLWWHCCCNISCHCFLEVVNVTDEGNFDVVNVAVVVVFGVNCFTKNENKILFIEWILKKVSIFWKIEWFGCYCCCCLWCCL
jgi:hypothetical protein